MHDCITKFQIHSMKRYAIMIHKCRLRPETYKLCLIRVELEPMGDCIYSSQTESIHCKNVRVILTLSGLAQLHLFRGFYVVKCKVHFNHENTSCMMWGTMETSEQIHCIIPLDRCSETTKTGSLWAISTQKMLAELCGLL